MFIDSFQEKIWKDKYQYGNESYEQFCDRIAGNIFDENELYYRGELKKQLMEFKVLFGGRINSNIGISEEGLTLFNCYIASTRNKDIDSLEGILDLAKEFALTLKSEGGIGFCANFLRPTRTLIRKIGVTTPGAIKFLEIFDKVSEVITAGSVATDESFQGLPFKKSIRKGATMVTMSICHPDIEDFIVAKAVPNKLTKMNMSVLVTDAFMYSLENDLDWDLWFPDINFERYEDEWDGSFEKWAEKGYPSVVYKTVRARDLWDLLMKNSWSRNEPGVLFVDIMRKYNNLHYLKDCEVNATNPCAEVFASTGVVEYEGEVIKVGDVCDLGSVNVVKFYDMDTRKFDYEGFSESTRLMARALDNVIDVSRYPLKQYEDAAKLRRKIGVGLTGIGSLLMMMDVRYGSEESLVFIEKMLKVFMNSLYKESAIMAKEKGPFAVYSDKMLSAGYVSLGILDEEVIELIKKNGLRNCALSAVAPNGCLVDGTIVSTTHGCFGINNFKAMNTTESVGVATDFDKSYFGAWYDMGYENTIKITTHHGYSIEGTPSHKIRVVTEGGGYAWRELKNVGENDVVVMKKDFIFNKKCWLRSCLSELLGVYMADGWHCGNRLYFQVHTSEVEHVRTLIDKCFKNKFSRIIERKRDDDNSTRIEVNSKKIRDWFEKYNCIKDGAENAFVPDIVMSSGKDSIVSFIRGYFFGDGGFNKSKQNIKFTSISDVLISQLQTLLLGIGVVSHKYVEEVAGDSINILGKDTTHNFNTNRLELSVYNSRKLCDMMSVEYEVIDTKYEGRNFEPVLLSPFEAVLFGDSSFLKFYNSFGILCVTDCSYRKKVTEENYNWFIKGDMFLDYVCKVEGSTQKRHVQDISVTNSSHTYVANGFITHNTLSILAGNVSGGIEPVFSKEFYRWNRVEGSKVDFKYPNVHKGEWFETDYFKETIINGEKVLMSSDGKFRVDVNSGLCEKVLIQDYGYKLAKEHGFENTQGATELSVEEHLKVLGLYNKYIDLSVSKTVNIPQEFSLEEFKKVYSELYKYGVKGCTTYRAGTSVAVLETTKKDQEKTIRAQQKEFLASFKGQENGDVVVKDVKLPEEYPAKGFILKADGNRKWYLHVAFKDKACTKPFAIFVNTNNREDNVVTFNALEKMEEIALSKGLEKDLIEETKRKYAYQKNPVKICRMLGLLLRHNISVFTIVKGFDELEDVTAGTFVFRMKKFLSQFVGDHEVCGMPCPECGEKAIIFKEGCFMCNQCGHSKCG